MCNLLHKLNLQLEEKNEIKEFYSKDIFFTKVKLNRLIFDSFALA